ncbi:MAG TPA: TIGR02217 family protein [Hellea balneolensis]|uniref:TIGR02217 family protein n=1 Tax=Hellea balneolensis TaxID=287478 RepID=A0A7V5NXS2_9PROT|nr:TIGR02217 family protein [Hellea balneolensis]
MAFHDVSFPLSLAKGASGGPMRRTEIVTLASGAEQRNAPQADSRRRYDVGVGVRSLADLQTLLAFFEARRGQLHGFRFRDPFDHSAKAEQIGIGDGIQTDFQLVKTYQDAAGAWVRTITRPVAGTVAIYEDGTPAQGVSVDTNTGLVSFNTPPASGKVLTADFEFDVPVRFDTDHIAATLEGFGAGKAVSVPLIEILPHAQL